MKGDEDLKAADQIRNVIMRALEDMEHTHPELFEDVRFGNWVVNVMVNIICKLAISFNVSRETILNIIGDIWDSFKKETDEVIN